MPPAVPKPPAAKTPWHTRLREFLQLLAVAGGIVAVTFGTAVAWLDSLSTDQEVRTAVAEHNLADTSHPRAALRAEAQERAIAELQASRAQTIELWRVLVGLGCSDREDDARLKAAAAAYCRDEYDMKIAKGATAPDAYRESIRQPWYTRPRIH